MRVALLGTLACIVGVASAVTLRGSNTAKQLVPYGEGYDLDRFADERVVAEDKAKLLVHNLMEETAFMMPAHAGHFVGAGRGHRGSGVAWSRGLNTEARETALQVYNTITREFREFNRYCKAKRISDGENVMVSGEVTVKPFAKKELYAIAGTAANLLGCRESIGADLDFWSRANLRYQGRQALRIEFTPAPNHFTLGKDHVWMKKDHYGGTPPTAVDPGTTLPDHVNPGWTVAENGDPVPPPPVVDPTGVNPDTWPTSMWIQTSIEFDIWSESANMWDHKVTYLIRQKVNKAGGLGIQFNNKAKQDYDQAVKDGTDPLPKAPKNYYDYIYTLHCGDLILQKVSLILNRKRMLKGAPSFARGQEKFKNDAGDLGCMCHHEKCKDNIMASAVLRDICNRDWLQVSRTIASVPQPTYQAVATAVYDHDDQKVQTINHVGIPAYIRNTFDGLDRLRLIPTL